MQPTERKIWAVVLAGGEGERMAPLTTRLMGRPCPKQYCTFVGTRSMLQHTYDRIAPIVDKECVVTVIGRGHRLHLETACRRGAPGVVIEQPVARGTAAGVFAGTSYVRSQDPSATVLILPADHFIYPEARFVRYLACAAATAEAAPERLAILAAAPHGPETDYGWIEPRELAFRVYERSACQVGRFREKPDLGNAQRYLDSGWLWNTMIMAAKVETLWDLGREAFPFLIQEMDKLVEAFTQAGPQNARQRRFQARVLPDLYNRIEADNFSFGLLERFSIRALAVAMRDLMWDDWGRPERIWQSLLRIGRTPVFPLHLLRELRGDLPFRANPIHLRARAG